MKTIRVKVSSRWYVVLPASLRKEMDINPGNDMLLRRDEDKIILQTIPSFTQKLAGLTEGMIGSTPEAVDNFIDQGRKDREI